MAALCGIALSIVGSLQRLDMPASVWGDALPGLMLASLLGATLGLLSAVARMRRLLGSFAPGGAVRDVSLLWSTTLGLAPPEGELVMMLGTLRPLLPPALLGLLERDAFGFAHASRSSRCLVARSRLIGDSASSHRAPSWQWIRLGRRIAPAAVPFVASGLD